MTATAKLLQMGAAGAAGEEALYVEDVFSTYLYTGNGSSQTINNGIGLGTAYGGSVFFDGNDDRLALSTNTVLNLTGDFTIEFWMYPTLLDTYKIIFDTSLSGTAGSNMTELWIRNTGLIEYYAQGSILLSGSGVVTNVWQHVALVRNGSTQTIYLNGTSVASTTSTTTPNTGYSWYIGDRTAGAGSAQYPYAGYLSNFRIVKGTAVYTSNFTPPTEPLTAISGTSLLTCQAPNATTDYSSNALPITVTNAIAQNGGGPFTDAEFGYGGLVWLKNRTTGGAGYSHNLYDTERGANKAIFSDTTDAQITYTTRLTSFNADGFSLGVGTVATNSSGQNYASWTFRKAEKFFDVVTYTGNDTAGRQIAHNLGSVPGTIIVKVTSGGGNWAVYHRSLGNTKYLYLNSTAAEATASTFWNNTSPTSTHFTVGAGSAVNTNGETYVAYLFAHDAGGFGLTGLDNVITCGSYTGNGSATGPTISLGYEPQWVLIKQATNAGTRWTITDNMRGFPVTSTANQQILQPNVSDAEVGVMYIQPTSTGFNVVDVDADVNQSGATYIYIAIRRGPMKTPESGTEVFSPAFASSSGTYTVTTGFPVDAALYTRTTPGIDRYIRSRLIGSNNGKYLIPNSTSEELTAVTVAYFDRQTSFAVGTSGDFSTWINWNFRRAPSFFDMVCYTGTGVARTVNHNLGVAPELMIVKSRNNASSWYMWGGNMPMTNTMFLEQDSPSADNAPYFNDTAPTASVFSVSSFANASTWTYVAYLFASCPGVSKVGSYTGSGTTKQINCGFTNGSRFVLIKRTDSSGDWYVWDSARGIVAGDDPYLLLNTADAQTIGTDYIDTYSAGFEISSTAPATINANGGTYIFLAIA